MLWIWARLMIVFLFGTSASWANLCLSAKDRDTRANLATTDSGEIVIKVSNNVLHQISSRVFGTLAREILNYEVKYEPILFVKNSTEGDKLYKTLDELMEYSTSINPKPALNLGVWMPADYHLIPKFVDMAGPFSNGRFGWFVPKQLLNDEGAFIPYTIFKNTDSIEYNQFIYDENLFGQFELEDKYVPDQCLNQKCVTLLSSHQEDTLFVKEHIDELKLYVKVAWFGDNLRYVTRALFKQFRDMRPEHRKAFVVVHWTPSEIIDVDIEYDTITMPKCEQFKSKNTLCKYELTPILKYCNERLKKLPTAYSTFSIMNFDRKNETRLLQMYDSFSSNDAINKEKTYDEIACKFIKENKEQILTEFIKLPEQRKTRVFIGGIYPKISEDKNEYEGITKAVNLAEEHIRKNGTLLTDIDLRVIKNNDGCHLDAVMKTFINYCGTNDMILGVLGPPCSETVEPIASLSKHINMAVISYSAEGVPFRDREKYPYFFRTIGANRQYEHVYVRLLKELNWHRVVAFTEDGQKYTEYISQLENVLKESGIELTNKKFSKYFDPEKMKSSLQDLKSKNSNIIIADIYDDQAGVVLCEAYKLQMSAKHGYVWFLPIWLDKNSTAIHSSSDNCTQDQIEEMLNGHFSLAHQSYASDNSMMETNATVGEWKQAFAKSNTSHYGGYAYDAVWVYALALDQLIKESPRVINNLQNFRFKNTTDRLIEIISETDFNGVSGHIQFGEGGSRFSNINVMQWIDNENRIVGTFEPNVSDVDGNRVIQGGNFNFSVSNIKWLTPNHEIPPSTSNELVCSVAGLAELLGLECSHTMLMITALFCSLLVIIISAASFIFWKRRYDQKLKASAKLMRNFGIDLLSMSPMHANTLDKWEISKDRVVINRRLGEGAFGTVYGGEAQIEEQGWTAVAVKTLKKGSNTEDRLDFLSEAEAMKRFDHSNVVQLLGVCLQSEPIYAVMEFMLYGDLKTYLLARRHLVNEKLCDESDISPKRLTMMALDVSKALAYLAEMKYVHRDVACRNCLVNAQRVVKLGDFGMARSTSENDYYRFSRKGMLPVRWMAPESLSLGKFTPASDVWSFAVLLYEIITFGSFPFQGLTNNQVLDHVKEGNTLTVPNGVKPQLEGLMKACWNLSYMKRPTASEVGEFIGQYPKLVTASLDVPLASVQIPETESDQLELLPGLRKVMNNEGNNEQPKEQTAYANRLRIPNGITLSEFNAANDDYTISNPATPSITYNPIEPLLSMYEDGDFNGSLRRYVPMCGFKKGNRALEMNEHVI